MKKSFFYAVTIIVAVISCSYQLNAQNPDSLLIPESVRTAIAKKYPGAEVKKWRVIPNGYTAKTKKNGQKYSVTFDHDANWISTESKLNWPWHMPIAVKNAYKKSNYSNWNIYQIRIVDSPAGLVYRIFVDDRNHPVDIFHQGQTIRNRTLTVKPDGKVIDDGKREEPL